MATTTTGELIEKIKAEELSDKRRSLRWLDSRSFVRTTKEITDSLLKKKSFTGDSLEIRRNLKLDLLLLIFSGLLIAVPIGYLTISEIISAKPNQIGVVVGIGLILLIFIVAYKNLTNRELNSTILLTDKQITVGTRTYKWDEIENTFLVYRPTGRLQMVYFVIGLKNGTIRYFDIGNQLGFKYNELDFAVMVEYFKNLYIAQPAVL
jgi:hypothetical protein